MPVIVRDAVAADHLVYAWPFPIGPEECEVSCSDDEQVVMCPSWTVGDRLGPGRHRWRTPDPSRPVSAYFVLTAPVEVSFDMLTSFALPTTGQPVRLRATGALHVRCADPGLLVAQFVGLPFDAVNDGITRSVSRSVERMLARLLTRRVVMAGTPQAVTDPQMLANIIEELVAYNPAAGAVFGVEMMRFGHLAIYGDDGTPSWIGATPNQPGWGNGVNAIGPNGETERVTPPQFSRAPTEDHSRHHSAPPLAQVSGEINLRAPKPTPTPVPEPPAPTSQFDVSTGHAHAVQRLPPPPPGPPPAPPAREPVREHVTPLAMPVPMPMPMSRPMPLPSSLPSLSPMPRKAMPIDIVSPPLDDGPEERDQPRGAIMGIGMGGVGSGGVASGSVASGEIKSGEIKSGEITPKVAPGGRVLVRGPDGLMQSATVRQLLQGYYELEVGGSGDTIWVPMNGVVPES
jgi:hypothetical protein